MPLALLDPDSWEALRHLVRNHDVLVLRQVRAGLGTLGLAPEPALHSAHAGCGKLSGQEQ